MKKIVVPCIIAALVVIIGAIVIYKIIHFCQEHFPPPPPDPATPVQPTNGVVSAEWHILGAAQENRYQETPGQPEYVELWLTNGVLSAHIPGTVTPDEFFSALEMHWGVAKPDPLAGPTAVPTGPISAVFEYTPDPSTAFSPVWTNAYAPTNLIQVTLPAPPGNSFWRVRFEETP